MNEYTFRGYLGIIRKRLLFVLLLPVSIAMMTAALCYFVIPKQYAADTTLLVNQKYTDGQTFYDSVLANEALVLTYSNIMKSKSLEQSVIQQLKLPYTLKQLDRMIQITSVNQSQIIDLRVTAPTEAQAVTIANTLADNFQQRAAFLMNIQNVEIVDPAVLLANASPVKPNKVLDIALALILGTILAIGIAILIEVLDVRLKSPDEVRDSLKLPVLATIHDFGRQR